MKAALDVYYEGSMAVASCVAFMDWADSEPADVASVIVPGILQYRPGRFYEREMPCLKAVLKHVGVEFDTIIVDGYVNLKNETGKGLGAHLFDTLSYSPAVVGVAKNPLDIADRFVQINRGCSRRPLFVSALGCRPEQAAVWIKYMHGPYRIPTLLRLADQVGRRRLCSTEYYK